MEIIATSPASEFRETLARKDRTARGRAESVNVVVAVLLGLDAGLRKGEAFALRWSAVGWGRDEDDPGRHLRIVESSSRGGAPGLTKSGPERKVALSRRLRRALKLLYIERASERRPDPASLVLADLDYRPFQEDVWPRVLARGGLSGIAYKDLRDSFASWLITAGVTLGYISRQLGHANLAITAKHYARWAGGDEYREPHRLAPGEVPADLLARIPAGVPRHVPQQEGLEEGRIEVPEEIRGVEGDGVEPGHGGAYWARTGLIAHQNALREAGASSRC
jgi:integrase